MEQNKHTDAVINTPGLIAFWDFVQLDDGIWSSYHDPATINQSFPLYLKRIGDVNDYSPEDWPYDDAESHLQYDASGPFGKAVHFNKGYIYAAVPRSTFDNTLLDIHGKQAFTLITWMKFTGARHMIAGIWDEGGWAKYSGRRQVALFGGLFGQQSLIAHISKTGASSYPQSEINGSQYARVRAIDGQAFDDERWVALAMSYDPDKNEVKAYLNGKMTPFSLTDPVEQDVYQFESEQVANPLSFTGPVYSPRAFTIKYNGYLRPEANIKEHRLLVDLNNKQLTYERDSIPGNSIDTLFRVKVDIQRAAASILTTPVIMDAFSGQQAVLPFQQPVAEGDVVITTLEKRNGDEWQQVGTRIERIIPEGAPFTLGRALGLASEEIEHGSQLFIDGVAVFNRVLDIRELEALTFLTPQE
ncbi:MAG: hypothetical protein R2824_20945 [Saprospiraceae bacterium]|nr:hypothetical protein [Lewinella sp.]